ncbi:MAG TPA: helix-turn-helix transcriptional regulator [Candidatus Udaeobacter sp.]|jgi:transcriptional regulator with XRE-family HTH domain|nr:helix-turn-helix transcriptional regulator [Candidatus Udaeobacter sp.]
MNIKNERLRRGWTLTKLSTLTNIAASDLSALENGKRPLYPGWRKRIERAMGVEITEFDQEVSRK